MKLLKLFAILSIFVLLTGCGDESESKSEVEPIRVGISSVFPPFDFVDKENQDYQGFDIDLIRAISKEINRPIQFTSVDFDSIIPMIQSKALDISISAITINDERKKSVLFSDPYFETGLQIAVQDDNTSINSIDDLKNKRVAVYIGTTADIKAHQIESITIKRLDAPAKCYDELEDGNVDAVINDSPFSAYLLAQGQIANVKILPSLLTHEEYGIAIQKDDVELQKQINDALKKIHENGEYDQIYKKWFGEK